MSDTNTNANLSLGERVFLIWEKLIAPHLSIEDLGERRRAQLLSVLTLILTALFIGAVISGPSSYVIFAVLGGITLVSYVLSRTKYYRVGIYIFTYAFTSIGYITIYLGTANSIESSITSTVHIALIFSSALLSQRGFLGLAILSTVATFTAPLYSNAPAVLNESVGRTGGVVLVINAVLYGIITFRKNLERIQARELGKTQDELSDAKTSLVTQLEKHAIELRNAHQQVQNRSARLQIIAEISQIISENATTRQLNEFLTVAAASISNKLGFYHVGIFLLDENRQYAVLQATNSKGGMQMLARHHQLKVGGTGIVGYVSQSGHPRIALDTGSDAVFFNNPDLPETRSEMALPLTVGVQTLGILDVQSTQSSAFEDEDLTTFSTLANHLAIAILNSQLREDVNLPTRATQNTRHKIQFGRNGNNKGFSYLADGTLASSLPVNTPSVEKAIRSGEPVILDQSTKSIVASLAIPVKVRDDVIGVIHIESAEISRKWTEDEIAMVQAVSERAALALENARLFEETSRKAEQERVVAEVTSRIGESNDFDRILRTTIETLGRTLGATRTFIQLDTPSSNPDDESQESDEGDRYE